VVLPKKKQIFVSRVYPDQTASKVLDYIKHKTKAKNITVEKFNLTYARYTSFFKISVPNGLFSTICSADFWPALMVVKEFETKNRNLSKKKIPVGT